MTYDRDYILKYDIDESNNEILLYLGTGEIKRIELSNTNIATINNKINDEFKNISKIIEQYRKDIKKYGILSQFFSLVSILITVIIMISISSVAMNYITSVLGNLLLGSVNIALTITLALFAKNKDKQFLDQKNSYQVKLDEIINGEIYKSLSKSIVESHNIQYQDVKPNNDFEICKDNSIQKVETNGKVLRL